MFDLIVIYIVKISLAPAILLLGLVGNILGLIISTKKRLKRIGPVHMYRYLYIIDSFYLLQIIVIYLQSNFDITIVNSTQFTCKLLIYLNYSFATISPMILVYISAERFVALKHSGSGQLRKKTNQLVYLLCVICFNSVYYIPAYLYFDLQLVIPLNKNGSNNTMVCAPIDNAARNLMTSMDMINRLIVPFVLMITFSILLFRLIFASRLRIRLTTSNKNSPTLIKDLKVAFSSICLNLVYMVLNSPFFVVVFLTDYLTSFLFVLAFYLFFICYAANFYILIFSNSLFRNELNRLLKSIC